MFPNQSSGVLGMRKRPRPLTRRRRRRRFFLYLPPQVLQPPARYRGRSFRCNPMPPNCLYPYHSYHSPFEDRSKKCMFTPHDVRIHEDITIDGGDGATVNIGCLMKCALKCGPNPSCILPCVLVCFGDNKDKA